ncbi:MAG: PTS sugar transporter subunit IIA [Thermoanaerobaculum sp.]|nr:PTS sugar transporter subunit IIA [Thermoanaerobaculum sp.]MCX7895746.1 PTS sugar transporter subunit IIA [Thermoanaerobaculum sp.]MDW7966959.1 PTS sugar transporter subunit IIA [Thermoanaerobaculum sp.]
MRLDHLLAPEHVLLDIPARTREEVLYYVAQALERSGLVSSAEDLVDHLLERERLGATLVGQHAAIPHCKIPSLKQVVVAFARTGEPVVFGPEPKDRARYFFFVLSPPDEPAAHLQVLAEIARTLRDADMQNGLGKVKTPHELLTLLAKRDHS